MKKLFLAIPLLAAAAGIFAFRSAEKKLADIFSQLGIEQSQAKEYIFGNFESGTLSIPYSKSIKKLATGDRAGAVQEIGQFIRKYSESTEFKTKYEETRSNAKPKEPESVDEYVKKRIEELENDIKTTEEDMKKTTGDMKKLYEATLKMQKDQLKALKNPKDPMYAMYAGKDKQMEEQEWKEYREALKDYEQEFPSDPKLMIKRRLQQFLELTADINFDAQLVEKYGKKRFADPKLEDKGTEWKMCFRSGKETIAAARVFAQQWLKELK